MAERPVFIPQEDGELLVATRMVTFTWHAGMAVSQKQKSIESLHEAARTQQGIERLLEISTKSLESLGVALSAFNLRYEAGANGKHYSLEGIFQSSKVFVNGGPYRDLRDKSAMEAKQDPRLKNSGHLLAFNSAGVDWPLEPRTAFYDWLYLNILTKQPDLANQLTAIGGFTDIEFNPKKSINCQAYSAALFVALTRRKLLAEALASRDAFIAVINRFARGETQGESGRSKGLF
ncbi:Uncharacterised protein [Pseudomonas fluorescens]|jgi:hypothetical protein|uniref:Uncharacterized protein n=1 Tax=Pseudomonas fluorescens TaxID=294 RepID=A0A379IG69_PSEFL|nr:hypothetical protein [Pseudomonas fluorescens]SUD31808.1 Uncharacterised protein [Pseudomonas fluorescens]